MKSISKVSIVEESLRLKAKNTVVNIKVKPSIFHLNYSQRDLIRCGCLFFGSKNKVLFGFWLNKLAQTRFFGLNYEIRFS